MTKHLSMEALLKGAQRIELDGQTYFIAKAQPTQGDVHVNTPLTSISIAYMQNASNFVADRVFPNVPVPKQSDRYWVYDRGFFNRNEMAIRAAGTESKGIGYQVDSTPSYYCPVYAVHHDIDDQVRANVDFAINPDRDAANILAHQALILKETAFKTAYMTTGVWSTDITGVASGPTGAQVLQWNDPLSTPIEDIATGKRTVAGQTGFEPNKLTLGREVYDQLTNHPDIVDRIKYGGQAAAGSGNPAIVTERALAALFAVEEVLVMNGIQNTAKEGQTNVHGFIGGKTALLTHSPRSPGLQVPSAGYTFSWTGYLGASDNGARIKKFRADLINSDRVELEMAFVQKVISADLGYYFTSIVA